MTQEERSKETRQSILDAAMVCLSQGDYNETQVDDICHIAGITKGAFYYHFSSKQELILELLNNWTNGFGDLLSSAKSESEDFLSVILNLPEKIKPIFINNINHVRIFLELYVKGISDPALKETVLKSYQGYLEFFSDIIEKGIKSGLIKRTNSKRVSRLLFALTVGLLIEGLIDPDGEDWESFAIECLKLIFK